MERRISANVACCKVRVGMEGGRNTGTFWLQRSLVGKGEAWCKIGNSMKSFLLKDIEGF